MDKESILKAAQENTYMGQEFERKESGRSNLLGSVVALCVSVTVMLVEFLCSHRWNWGLTVVLLVFAAVDSLYEGVRLKRPYMTVAGVVQLIGAAIAVYIFVSRVVNV